MSLLNHLWLQVNSLLTGHNCRPFRRMFLSPCKAISVRGRFSFWDHSWDDYVPFYRSSCYRSGSLLKQ